MQMPATNMINPGLRQDLPREKELVRQAQPVAVSKNQAALLEKQKSSNESLAKSITKDLERISLVFNKKLKFVEDYQSREIVVKVIDSETDKVIKELPPKEL
jgi:flagellar protein FlaG